MVLSSRRLWDADACSPRAVHHHFSLENTQDTCSLVAERISLENSSVGPDHFTMALPAACTIAGNPDMYGLGIRTAFYLDWFAALIVERVNEQHTQILRGAELVLASAVFLGLAIAATAGRLHAVEVYIALLLVSGTVYLLAPRHATDLAVWTRPELYPGYQGRGFGIAAVIRCLFIVVVISLHMWFWVTGVDSASIDRQLRAPYENGCRRLRQVGFAFAPVELRSGWFRALNVLLMSALLAGGVLIGGVKAGLMKKGRSRRRHRAKYVKGDQTRKPGLTMTARYGWRFCAISRRWAGWHSRAYSSPPLSSRFSGTRSRRRWSTRRRPRLR